MQIGLGGLLFVAFLVMKLTGYIAWSWLWVTAPLWIGAALAVLFLVLFSIIGAGAVTAGALAFKKHR